MVVSFRHPLPLVFAVVVCVFAIQVALIGTMVVNARSEMDGALRANALGGGQAAAAVMADALRNGLASDHIQSLMVRLRDANRYASAVLSEVDGRILADGAGEPGGRLSPLAADPTALTAALRGPVVQELDQAGNPIRRLYLPVVRPGHDSAILVIDQVDLLPALREAQRLPVTLFLAAATLATGLVVLAVVLALRAWRRSTRAAERSSSLAAAGAVAAGVAHEVRNPLGTALATAELLARRQFRDAEDRELLTGLIDEIGRADAQLTAFLDVVRETPLRFVPVDLADIVRSVVGLSRVRAQQAQMDLVPVCAEPIPTMGDPGRLRQALLNLVLNAIEAGPGGSLVEIHALIEAGRPVLAVRDRGPGIAKAVLAADPEGFTTTKPGGTGLGLRLARRTAERHGGTLQLRTRPEGGTEARLVLGIPEPPCAS